MTRRLFARRALARCLNHCATSCASAAASPPRRQGPGSRPRSSACRGPACHPAHHSCSTACMTTAGSCCVPGTPPSPVRSSRSAVLPAGWRWRSWRPAPHQARRAPRRPSSYDRPGFARKFAAMKRHVALGTKDRAASRPSRAARLSGRTAVIHERSHPGLGIPAIAFGPLPQKRHVPFDSRSHRAAGKAAGGGLAGAATAARRARPVAAARRRSGLGSPG
jgi:hypothetical protein